MASIYNSQLDAFELYHKHQSHSLSSSSSTQDTTLLTSLGHALAGSIGASISNVATYPLDLIITRLQIQRQLQRPSEEDYAGLEDALKRIYRDEGGVVGLYTGLLQDTGKTVADSFIFFLTYHFFRERRIKVKSRSGNGGGTALPAVEELGVGFVAGALTKLITTPIANIVTRKQAAAFTARSKSGKDEGEGKLNKAEVPSSSQIARDIMEQKGMLGFWSGYSASLFLTLNPSLTFFLFEMLKRIFLPKSKRDNPPASATFLLAAISKACSSSVTYPFSLAKTRLQAGAKREENDEDQALKKDTDHRRARDVARATIFSTLLTVAQNEGIPALYEGLHLEVFKAFFSHGITMLVKQVIQRLLSQAYYIISIVLNRYKRKSSGFRLADKAKQSVEYYNLAMARASEKAEDAKAALKAKANETAEFVAEYVEEEDEGGWRDLYGTTGLAKWLESGRK